MLHAPPNSLSLMNEQFYIEARYLIILFKILSYTKTIENYRHFDLCFIAAF